MDSPLPYRIIPLGQVSASAIEQLLDSAFGEDRHTRTAYRMRVGVRAIPALSFAAVDHGKLLGTLQSWPVALLADNGARYPLTLVGPVAVDPTLQRGGIGRALMTRLMQAALNSEHDALVMIGDPEYYGRFFGFSDKLTGAWEVPGPVERRRLLALVTRDGSLPAKGVIIPDTTFATPSVSA